MTTTIHAALAKALPLVGGAKKDSNNPHFKSKYADLGSVIDAIRPVADLGIWFRQVPVEHEDGACIKTLYVHESGELDAGSCFVPASKKDAQGFGSAMTYARRYGLMAAFGIAPEDDDGNAATKSPPPAREPQKRAPDWDAPIKNKSNLHKALIAVDRNIRGCGDHEELDAYLATDEYQAFQTTAEEYSPHYLYGGPPSPEEFVGITDLIAQMRKQFDAPNALTSG